MSLLEVFAESGSLLTLATTHHGELKALKYSNPAFENACMEFDEVDLKPTYKILWGIPGRSNAINIAERLGLPQSVLHNARELYGTTSAELNELIVDMERFKQVFHQCTQEAQKYLTLSSELHKKLLVAQQKITEHSIVQRKRKMQELSQSALQARSSLHRVLREARASIGQPPKMESKHVDTAEKEMPNNMRFANQPSLGKGNKIPNVGDIVLVPSLRKRGTVLKVDVPKGEVIVQANNMKLKLNMGDVEA